MNYSERQHRVFRFAGRLGQAAVVGAVWVGTFALNLAADTPVVFWQSDPIRPGQTILLYGAELSKTAAMRVGRLMDDAPGVPGTQAAMPGDAIRLPVIMPSETSVKAILPDEMAPGVYAAQVETSSGASPIVLLNAPRMEWVQGDAGLEATPGGWVRVFGRCLGWKDKGAKTVLRLMGPKNITLSSEADVYSARAQLPKNLPIGRYEIVAHNGCGGPMAWSRPEELVVSAPSPDPERTYNVKQFGAVGDGATDDTLALTRILEQVRSADGGILFFPRGQYRLSSTLELPPHTVLRGESQNLSHLFWTNPRTARLECVVRGPGHFKMEDLTLWFLGAENGIVTDTRVDDAPVGHVSLQRLCVRWALYGGLLGFRTADEILRQTAMEGGAGARGSLLRLNGPNIRVTDCDLYSSASALVMDRADGARISGNRMYVGRMGYVMIRSGRRMTFENNRISGGDNMARAGMFFMSEPYVEQLYFGQNDIARFYNSDAEALTTDGGSPQYFGRIADTTDMTVTLTHAPKWLRQGPLNHALFVAEGKGKGQYRRVVKYTASTVTIDRPWTIVPDTNSLIGINQSTADWLIVGNHFADADSVQMYGLAFNVILADNELVRIGGKPTASLRSYSLPQGYQLGVQPAFFLQMLGNRIAAAGRLDFRHLEMGATAIEIVPADCPVDSPYPSHIAPIVRDSQINGGEIALLMPYWAGKGKGTTPLIEDAIVEHNSVSNSNLGIAVLKRSKGVVLRGNTFQRVVEPLSGDGLDGVWLHPADRTRAQLAGLATLISEQTSLDGPPPEWTNLVFQLDALGRKQKDDPAVASGCQAIWRQAVEAMRKWRPTGHSLRTLEALCGLNVTKAPATVGLDTLLAGRCGGTGELHVTMSLTNDAAPATVTIRPTWPEQWKAMADTCQVAIQPGASTTAVFGIQVPTNTWGIYDVPINIEVALEGMILRGQSTLSVGRDEIGDWMVIGPFANKDAPSLDLKRHPPEDVLDLNMRYSGVTGTVAWAGVHALQGNIKDQDLFKQAEQGTAYALTCLRASQPVTAELVVTGRGFADAWLNYSHLGGAPGGVSAPYRVLLSLRAGDNFLLLKVCRTKGNVGKLASLRGASGLVQVVSAEEMREMSALLPQSPNGVQALKMGAGVAWSLIYSDDFERETLGERWSTNAGTWTIQDGTLHGENKAFLAYATKLTAPIRIEYDAMSPTPSDLSAFWLDAPPDISRGYLLGFADSNQISRIFIGGKVVEQTVGPKVAPREWQHVIAQILPDGRVQIIANGKVVQEHRRSEPPKDERYPGLWTWERGIFDNVKIYTGTR